MAENPIALTRRDANILQRMVDSARERIKNTRTRRRRHVTGGGGGSSIIQFRLEEELLVTSSASARLIDTSLITLSGDEITVTDDDHMWFGRGEPATHGNDGGDERGLSHIGKALDLGDGLYSIISMGHWCRFIKGTLAEDEKWRVYLDDIIDQWNGEWVRPDDVQESGALGEYLTLDPGCIPTSSAVAGNLVQAVFDEYALIYRLWPYCC